MNVCFAFSRHDLQKPSNRVDTLAPNISLAELLSSGCLYHSANFNMLLEPVMADQELFLTQSQSPIPSLLYSSELKVIYIYILIIIHVHIGVESKESCGIQQDKL